MTDPRVDALLDKLIEVIAERDALQEENAYLQAQLIRCEER